MGFFSWRTADTRRSIANHCAGRDSRGKPRCKPVYLLQPNGKPSIFEPEYEGYGMFGGVDAYVWLAEHNLPAKILRGMDEEDRRSAGISLDCGSIQRDTKTGKLYTVFHPVPFVPDVTHLGVHWDQPLQLFDGRSANQLSDEKRFEHLPVSSIFPVKYPLKFSFRADAKYEDLPASKCCPKQGYFYD